MLGLCAAALAVGLLGSLHCAGMCGPLAVAVACGRPRAAAERMALFVAGKGLTYAALGAAAGTLGAGLGNASPEPRVVAAVALLAGALMVWFGAENLWRRRLAARPAPLPAAGVLIARLINMRGRSSPLAAGLLAGLLPCGLVYAMLAQSVAAAGTWGGGLIMLSFGAGTTPSVVAAGWLCSRIGLRSRRWAEWLSAGAVIAMGGLAVWRGLALLLAGPHAAGCCHQARL